MQLQRSPMVFRNWLAMNEGQPCIGAAEYPLFTDAHLTGQISQGPYLFINTVPDWEEAVVKPAIVLRRSAYLEFPNNPDMTKTDSDLYHGGSVAEEVAALASLALGIRVRAGGATRRFDGSDPKGTPIEWTARSAPILLLRDPTDSWVLPNAAEGEHALDNLDIFATLTRLTAQNAVALVRTSRLYQDALWLVESETALAWVMLVSAVETAADQWRKDKASPAERLKASKTELYEYLLSLGADVPERVAGDVADSLGTTKKFLDFLMNFKPPAPSSRPPEWVQHPWDDASLKRTIGKVYKYRSLALHEGKPFPAPMCEPPRHLDKDWTARTEIPFGTAVSTGGGTWLARDIPILFHTFEYLARQALLKWWREGTPEQ